MIGSDSAAPQARGSQLTGQIVASNYRWAALGLLTMIQLVTAIDTQSMAPLAPFYLPDLKMSEAQAGLLFSAFFFGNVFTAIPTGLLADIAGAGRILLVSLVLTGLSLLALSWSPTLGAAAAFMALMGIVYSSCTPATTKAVAGWFPARQRGTAISIKQMGYTLGGVLAGAMLPTLALRVGWRYTLGLLGLATVLFGFINFAFYRDPEQRHGGKSIRAKLPTASELYKMVRDPNMRVLYTAWFLHSVAKTGALAYLVLFLHESLRLPVTVAGIGMALGQIAATGGRLCYGALSDFVFGGRRKPVLILGISVGLLSCLIISLLSPGVPTPIALAAATLVGLGTMATVPIFILVAAELAGTRLAGTSTGVGITISNAGLSLGPLVFGGILGLGGSYTLAWRTLALTLGLGLAILLFYKERAEA